MVIKTTLLEILYYIGYAFKRKHQPATPQKSFRIAVISIGNITLGGTGKTPAAIAVAEESVKRGLSPGNSDQRIQGKRERTLPCVGF